MGDVSKSYPADVAGAAAALFARATEILKVGERLALCTIVRLAGSGPRRAGAKMLVLDGGESVGTVGAALWRPRPRNGRARLCRMAGRFTDFHPGLAAGVGGGHDLRRRGRRARRNFR